MITNLLIHGTRATWLYDSLECELVLQTNIDYWALMRELESWSGEDHEDHFTLAQMEKLCHRTGMRRVTYSENDC